MGFFDSIGDALSGAAGDIASSVIGGGLSFLGQSSANSSNQSIAAQTSQMNAAEAQKNRDFQERMRATQYQTAVEDMKAAGLNPMLAYSQGGAGTPSGSVGYAAQASPMQNALGAGVEGAQRSRSTTAGVSQTKAQIENLKEQNQQIRANTAQSESATLKNVQDTKTSAMQELLNAAAIEAKKAEVSVSNASAARQAAEAASVVQDIERMKRDVPRQEAESAKSQTWWGKNVTPYLRDLPFVNSGAAAVRNVK